MLRFFVAFVFCMIASGTVFAASTGLDVLSRFVVLGGLSQHSSVSFGYIDVSGLPVSNGRIRMGPNASINNNIPEFSLAGGHTAGHVALYQDIGNIEIRCTRTLHIANGIGDTVFINRVRISLVSASGWGAASDCNNLTGAPAATYDLTADPASILDIFIGARLRINNGNPLNSMGVYNSSNPGGEFIELEVTVL